MHAFIIRPFGTKQGIDFDRVEAELIAPALNKLRYSGGTTAEFMEQGNIRSDMFEQLLIADLIVADISIHNANVFYELGIRHACRERSTFLIRSEQDDVPFDLKTDRYLCYDSTDPGASLDLLVEGLRRTRVSMKQDSPVFQLLPGLEQTDVGQYLVVPADFREEVERAETAGHSGHLQLLSAELDGFAWRCIGLRLIGQAQIRLCDWEGARASLLEVRKYDRNDLEANTLLGTIDQRLGDLVRSDQALERALQHRDLDGLQRAEIHALMGRNAKTRWEADWRNAANDADRQIAALGSPHLQTSFEFYHQGFVQDRNHFYSGINALAMVTMLTELANALPDVWEDGFESGEEAERSLDQYNKLRSDLRVGVRLALQSRQDHLRRAELTDAWTDISQADLTLMTSARPRRVQRTYKNALSKANDFQVGTMRDQLLVYRALNILPDNVAAGLDSLPNCASPESTKPPKVILFTGHRVDHPDRAEPRFPADRIEQAHEMIHYAVKKELENSDGDLLGIAGAANGGDILFQETCAALKIPCRVHLALPANQYIEASVTGAGSDWVQRFREVCAHHETRVLSESDDLPHWLLRKADYGIWQRSNLWMLYAALQVSKGNMVTMAFWDGKEGDGPGGTEDMIERTQARGARFVHVDARVLMDGGES
ncbi:MAG: tetratricopeptide repeat-containing protein [Gammaproteobacteria bacterium]